VTDANPDAVLNRSFLRLAAALVGTGAADHRRLASALAAGVGVDRRLVRDVIELTDHYVQNGTSEKVLFGHISILEELVPMASPEPAQLLHVQVERSIRALWDQGPNVTKSRTRFDTT
jgi:hypothetical protein